MAPPTYLPMLCTHPHTPPTELTNTTITQHTSPGFSVGVSLLDLTGSLLSIIVLVLEADNYKADPEAIMPYGIIVGMQVRVTPDCLIV